jgi:putative ABC transport system permease protein
MAAKSPFGADRFFRALLRILPFEFRGDHGTEMEQVFRAQRREAREEGSVLATSRLWFETIHDIITTAPHEHLSILRQDLSYALRALRRSPVFACTAVLTLALGIGATTGLYSIIDAFLFRPLPVSHPEQLLSIATLDHHIELPHGLSLRDLDDYRARSTVLSDLIGSMPFAASLNAGLGSERIGVEGVTGNYFSMLGVPPALGRVIAPEEGRTRGDAPVVVLAYRYWQTRFASDPGIVGRAVRLNGQPFTIVGVAAESFTGTEAIVRVSVYVPISMVDALTQVAPGPTSILDARDAHNLRVLGRLKPGVSLAQARANLAVISAALARQYPDTNEGVSLFMVPETQARPEPATGPWFHVAAGAFAGLAALLLLITSANIANLLLARAATRGREIAIRTSLGARRGRLVRQLLTESLLLSILAGATAVAVAFILLRLLSRGNSSLSYDFPLAVDARLDWRVLSVTFLVACIAGVASGLAPALYAIRADVNALLKTGGRTQSGDGGGRLRSGLVVAQIAVSLTLLVVGGLFMRSLDRARHLDLGFTPDHLLVAKLAPGMQNYDEAQRLGFYRRVRDRVAALPDVRSVSWVSPVPFGDSFDQASLFPEGQPIVPTSQAPIAFMTRATPEYFATAGVRLVAGRAFEKRDDDRAPGVVLLNETLAHQLWPNQNPIGRHLRLEASGKPVEVVGVVKDGKYIFVWEDPRPMVFQPLAQAVPTTAMLEVRTAGPPENTAAEVRETIKAIDPDVPISGVQSMTSYLEMGNAFIIFHLGATLSAFFGVMGLLLASIGLYGVIAFHVTERSHEIGVRMALGARAVDILRDVIGSAMRFAAAGIAAGIVVATIVALLMRPMLLGVSPFDPLTYGGVMLLLTAICLLASAVPARRATAVDPLESLRAE